MFAVQTGHWVGGSEGKMKRAKEIPRSEALLVVVILTVNGPSPTLHLLGRLFQLGRR
jgi:hypothetical protein